MNAISFAEAMALPPDKVEVQIGAVWISLASDAGSLPLWTLREKEFRHARPARPEQPISRVEEMAGRRKFHALYSLDDYRRLAVDLYTEAVKEICAFFHEESTNTLGDETGQALVREFLVKR